METSKKSRRRSLNKKILIGVGIFIILFIIIGAIGSGSNKNTTTKTSTPVMVSNKVSQSAAENYCQDAGLLGKYIDTKTTDIVTLSYNPQYVDSGTKATNGDEIWDLQWTGKNKSTGEGVGFVCMVSGTDKSITLHDLAINGTAVYGPVDEK